MTKFEQSHKICTALDDNKAHSVLDKLPAIPASNIVPHRITTLGKPKKVKSTDVLFKLKVALSSSHKLQVKSVPPRVGNWVGGLLPKLLHPHMDRTKLSCITLQLSGSKVPSIPF